ncbi:MAG: sce7725 family protein [Nitrospinae bacterium]|nr:sce7725 family protein [Nitrospinota bacterium]
MYYPYFRGKQYELVTIRERAALMAENKFLPIIEPVKDNLSPLKRSIDELTKQEAKFILVVNPKFGDLKNNPTSLFKDLINDSLKGYTHLMLGYIVDANSNLIDIKDFVDEYKDFSLALIHHGFPNGKDLKEATDKDNVKKHIFIDRLSGKLYQKHFKGCNRILIRDGFEKQKNADYPPSEHFSDLHITYDDEGMDGFGDFLIVGDDYMETGGPAYAVAIHLTYTDKEGDMFMRHFVSDRTNTPTDPAGKFFEALEKLKVEVEDSGSMIFKSSAVNEFLELHKRGHFPGLGYVKKLSMIHHIELMADFMKRV